MAEKLYDAPMRRSLTFLFVFLLLAAGVTVSAKTVQERRAERMARRSLTADAVSSVSSKPATIYKPTSVPILVYHHVRSTKGYAKSTWSWKMSVSPTVFEKQMQWIKDHGYTTVNLDAAASILQGEGSLAAKPVVITFDDNNENVYASGFPVLKKLGLTATWYVITNRFDKPTFLTTAQVKELAAAGMDIQSHSVTHPWLTSLSVDKQRWELDESRKAIEALTGKPVHHLAYPLTMRNARVVQTVREEKYETATIMDPRPATAKDDLLLLPRIMMTDDTKLEKVLP
jgi:peptidoglycan/xylan/chitin deacetylase (PgdA/CDA1 family)